MSYKIVKKDGKFELWWVGETVKSLLGVYDSRKELEESAKKI